MIVFLAPIPSFAQMPVSQEGAAEVGDGDEPIRPQSGHILENGTLPQYLPLPENRVKPAQRANVRIEAGNHAIKEQKNVVNYPEYRLLEKTEPYLFTKSDFFYIKLPLVLFSTLNNPNNYPNNQIGVKFGSYFNQNEQEWQGAGRRSSSDRQSRQLLPERGSTMMMRSSEQMESKKGKPISQADIDLAVAELIAEQPARIMARVKSFGEPQLQPGADPINGRPVFVKYCGECHGEDGSGPSPEFNNGGKGIGPYGRHQPFLFLKVLPLNRLRAGGTTQQFAERSAFGAHATLPNMTTSAVLPQETWADVQAYVAQFERPVFEPQK